MISWLRTSLPRRSLTIKARLNGDLKMRGLIDKLHLCALRFLALELRLKNILRSMLVLPLIFLTTACGNPALQLLGVNLDFAENSSELKTQRPDVLVNPTFGAMKTPGELKQSQHRDYICLTHEDSIELRAWIERVTHTIKKYDKAIDYYENAIDKANGVKKEEETKKKD